MTSWWSRPRGASASAAIRTFFRWFSAVIASPRRSKAFPPRATRIRMHTPSKARSVHGAGVLWRQLPFRHHLALEPLGLPEQGHVGRAPVLEVLQPDVVGLAGLQD